MTNDHVVEGASQFTSASARTARRSPAKLVGKDASTDLAVLQVDAGATARQTPSRSSSPSSESLRPGDAAIAIGSPFGLSGTVTTGIISALDREIQSPNGFPISGVLQTDAAINPGNSGGPLLDARGPRDRRQLADRLLVAPAQRRRLRRPGRHGQAGRAAAHLAAATSSAPTSASRRPLTRPARGAVVGAITAGGPAATSGLRRATGSRRSTTRECPIRTASARPCCSASPAIPSS